MFKAPTVRNRRSVVAHSAVVFLLCVSLVVGCARASKPPTSEAPAVKPVDYIVRVTGSFPLYPDPAVGSDAVEASALMNLYDPLVFPALDGTVQPHVATEWSVSPNGLEYTFKLRQGVKFHDGTELTAEDVAFSMKRLLTIGEGFAYLFTPYVSDAVALDKYTVRFTLKKPYGPFVSALTRFFIVNKNLVIQHIEKPGPYGEMGDYGKKWLLTNDAGSGPYKIKEMKLEEYLLAEKFQDWWKGWQPNTPNYLKFVGTCEPTTVRTLMGRHELEVTDEWQPPENLKAMDEIEGVEVTDLPMGALVCIYLHTKKPPTDDVHFRKALAYAMDYETVVTQILPGAKRANGPVAWVYAGHDPNLPRYEFDLEKAREELKKSKYYGQLDKYPITLVYSADVPMEEKVALLLQANAAKLGIKVEVQKAQWGMMVQMAEKIGTTPHAAILLPSDSYAEAGSVLQLRYHSSTCGTFTQYEWLQNPEIDALIEKALGTTDKDERFKIYSEIQRKLVVELCPTIWICDYAERRAWAAGYMQWDIVDAAKAGKLACPVMGRAVYGPEMKVFPEKRMELLNKK